ncbi:MAG: hypothetical protein LBU60_05210 [Clostridiales bacterium]|jgi:hypothetical protein|nr:hypothetical protein [Clostridiales bacterium]
MANLRGEGQLVGYKTYTGKDKIVKHVYTILNNSDLDEKTGLYSVIQPVEIVESGEQKLSSLRPQKVGFEAQASMFRGEAQYRYVNIRELE